MNDNIIKFPTSDAMSLAIEISERVDNIITTIIEEHSDKESSLEDIMSFTLTMSGVVRGLIHLIGSAASFDGFDSRIKRHFAKSINSQLDEIQATLEDAIKNNNKIKYK